MVPRAGLEPACPFGRWILSHGREVDCCPLMSATVHKSRLFWVRAKPWKDETLSKAALFSQSRVKAGKFRVRTARPRRGFDTDCHRTGITNIVCGTEELIVPTRIHSAPEAEHPALAKAPVTEQPIAPVTGDKLPEPRVPPVKRLQIFTPSTPRGGRTMRARSNFR